MMNMMTLNSYQVGGDHYASKDIQPWDVMQAWMTKEAFAGYLHGNCIKYLARYLEKNGAEDLKKCKHYLSKLIELEERNAVSEQSFRNKRCPTVSSRTRSCGTWL
jgi:hypothetical protein